jgi:hypothetical protein
LSSGNVFVFQAIAVAPVDVKMPRLVTQPGSRFFALGMRLMSSVSSMSLPWSMKRPPTSTRSHSGAPASTIALILRVVRRRRLRDLDVLLPGEGIEHRRLLELGQRAAP